MDQVDLPVPLARIFMRVVPAPVLSRMVNILMAKMERRHPRLFKNLERLSPAVVHFEPTDLPHRFELKIGCYPATLEVITGEAVQPDASVKGSLESLLDMLEGRLDGDMLFFSRQIIVTGDTSVIVGLRNTIDRENIRLLEDVTSLLGPFAGPTEKIMVLLDQAAKRLKARLTQEHERLHLHGHEEDDKAENARLRKEVEALKSRLVKLEVQKKRSEASAT